MALKQFEEKAAVHKAGDPFLEYEVILKGTVTCIVGGKQIDCGPGSIIGSFENDSDSYRYSYDTAAGCVLYGYSIKNGITLEEIVRSNEKIAPQMASAAVKNAAAFCVAAEEYPGYADGIRKKLQDEIADYLSLCASLKRKPKTFPNMSVLPEVPDIKISSWRFGFINTFVENDDMVRKQLYTLGNDMCTGIVMTAHDFMVTIADECRPVKRFILDMEESAMDFKAEYEEVKIAVRNKENLQAQSDALSEGNMPDLSDAVSTIITYAELDSEKRTEFMKYWEQYKAVPDRTDASDDMRKLRRQLTQWFYSIYSRIFFKTLDYDDDEMPIEIRMFLYTGFFDMETAGEKNTEKLFDYVVHYSPDPKGQVFLLYEWLLRIFDGDNEPSRNEFDMDYPASLRDRKMNGEITAAMMEELMDDPDEKVRFEMKNLFELGNRMTFGRVSMFFPFFDEVNVLMPLEKIYVTADRIREELKTLRNLDFQCFYHEDVFTDPTGEIPQLMVHHEYLPYFILMPNVGSRSVLWQEIEGKKRSSHARMLMPFFNIEELSDAITQVCGEFRWEMCKTEQGVHWNDLSDPSLTAEYSDYLQYYRKNSSLNPEQKEKLKKLLQKASNNYRRVFVADYLTYIKFETRGALRLNKVARQILFTYCPFSAAKREELAANPQYQQLIERRKNKVNQKARPLLNIIHKMENKGDTVPSALKREIEFYKL